MLFCIRAQSAHYLPSRSHNRGRQFIAISVALFASIGLPAALLSPDPGLEDTEANLIKTLQGFKVGDPARYRDVVSPLRTDKAAFSPDGQHVAYTVRINDEVYVHVVAVDEPTVIKSQALVHTIERSKQDPRHDEFGLVDWLGWVTPTRLVIASNGVSRKGGGAQVGVVTAMNADGSDARVLAIPGDFREIAFAKTNGSGIIWAIGLHPGRFDSIIFVASIRAFRGFRSSGNDRHLRVTYSLNVLTGEVKKLGEAFTTIDALALADRLGRARITVGQQRSNSMDIDPTILYQPAAETEIALPLDKVTGVHGFNFRPETILRESSLPLGFDAKGDILYYASNVGRDTYGIYALDLVNNQHLPGIFESPTSDLLSPQLGTFDGTEYIAPLELSSPERLRGQHWRPSPQLVMDRFTHKLAGVRYEGATRTATWLRRELQAVQERLAAERPGRSAEILEWDESLNRFLVREQAPGDAGAFFVLDRQKDTYTQFVRRGPEPEDGSIRQLTPFDFKLPDGSRIEGLIALPKDSKVKKIPLVLLCPDNPWQRRGTTYQPEFEALTRMGFAVAIYNGRGVWGTGIRERQKLQGDYVSMQANDAVAVADHLASKFDNVSRRSVALFGQGHGGFVALRALQLHPQRFRAAVTVDAWLQGNAFFDAIVQGRPLKGSYEKVTRPTPTPLTEQPELIKAPVFTIVEFSQTPRYHANTALHRAVKRNAPDSELFVQTDKLAERPQLLARQWARTESFLNYVLYTFSVSLGELEILPDEAPKPKQP